MPPASATQRRGAGRPRRPRRTHRGALLAGLVVAGACGSGGEAGRADGPVAVAVAANVADVAGVLARRFTAETGREVTLAVGSTGQLYAQIRQGAPFDVFLAADRERPRRLEEEGLAVPGTRATYALGRLVLFAPGPDSVTGPERLRRGGWAALAVANPRTAPYGAAALQALERLGLADAVADRLVRGESVGQTLQFVRSGAAEMGFVALAQVIREPARSYWIVPDSLHDPILQELVLLDHGAADPGARAFVEFMGRPGVREVLRSFGYGVPGEAP